MSIFQNENAKKHRELLIIGLGNPGREYSRNRHNVGFMMIDRFAERIGLKFERIKHNTLISDGRLEGDKIILAKPLSFMNLSGQAVKSLVSFYKINNENVLIVYDELDISQGVIRLRPGGGAGGHKGMRSVIDHLGEGVNRLRIGIGRPPEFMDPADYVLQNFTELERVKIDDVLDHAVEAVLCFIKQGISEAMENFNGVVE